MIITTPASYETALAYLGQHDEVTCDTETTGLAWQQDSKVCGVSMLAGEQSFYFPFRHADGPNLPEPLLHDLVERMLPRSRPQLGFNYGFDVKMLSREGMELPDAWQDSMLSAHLLNENELSYKMEVLATKYVDPTASDEEEKLIDLLVERFGGGRKKAKGNLWRLASTEVAAYAEQDVWTTRNLRDLHTQPLQDWKLGDVADGVHAYARALTRMEMNGLPLDVDLIAQHMEESGTKADELEAAIQEAAGYAANPRSSKQMQALLEVPSTAKDVIEAMDNPLAQTLLDYRIYSKANSNYYRPFMEHIAPTGLLHPNFRMTGTKLTRLSCANPNLQAIPRSTERYRVKDVFVAPEGYILLEADYSQAEMRVATHYAQEARMRELILAGADLHGAVAEERNMPRDIAKRLNFSVIYGIGARKFSKTYKIPFKDAQVYIRGYHEMFPGFRRLYNSADAKAQQRGYIRWHTGRVRHFNHPRLAPSHKASSNLIQGAVGEMMRTTCVRLDNEVPDARQLLQVHDSFLFALPLGPHLEMAGEIKRIMEDQPWCSLPMRVDMKMGASWGTAKEITW